MRDRYGEQTWETFVALLYCPECADERPHRVTYVRGVVVETVCSTCGRALVARRRPVRVRSSSAPTLSVAVGSSPPPSPRYTSSSGYLPTRPVPRSLRSLAVELPLRAMTKPSRLWREVRSNGPAVLLTMPRRAATKPMRLIAELTGVARRVQ